MTQSISLKYGCNPHQKPASVSRAEGLPFEVLNGSPGYINLLDALNSWALVREARLALNLPVAASFKHVSPAGVALGIPLDDTDMRMCHQVNPVSSLAACAYVRARGADRMSSFGDWIAISDRVDEETARIIKPEVSDGIIAPDYDPEAVKILSAKKGGNYPVLKMNPDYSPEGPEKRDVFGVTFEQLRNDVIPTEDHLKTIATDKKDLPEEAKRDMILAAITLKYTQSNSVCYAWKGQVIGVGAGQQSRIHCTRLAGSKADKWFMRRHPAFLDLPWLPKTPRPIKDNAIDQYWEAISETSKEFMIEGVLEHPVQTVCDRKVVSWLSQFNETVLASDAFFPFSDNIERAAQSGVRYIIQPGGSNRDDNVIESCNKFGMVMVFTGLRLFHH